LLPSLSKKAYALPGLRRLDRCTKTFQVREFFSFSNSKNSTGAPDGNAAPQSRAFLTLELLKTKSGFPPSAPHNCG
jgi:hypothetical protein